jgi:hypothetical protein
VSPKQYDEIIELEEQFGTTIKRGKSLPQFISDHSPYESVLNHPELLSVARSTDYKLPITSTEKWVVPAGVKGEKCGAQ